MGENNSVDKETIEKLKKQIEKQETEIHNLAILSMNKLRIFITGLTILITGVVVFMTFFGIKSMYDIGKTQRTMNAFVQSVKDSVGTVYKDITTIKEIFDKDYFDFLIKQELVEEKINDIERERTAIKEKSENLNKAIREVNDRLTSLTEEGALKQILPIYTSRGGFEWFKAYNYEPIYDKSFPKNDNYESLLFWGEFRSTIVGDTAFFRFYVTDKKDTLTGNEITVTSSEFKAIECNLDISKLMNTTCELGFAVKTQENNKAELQNINVSVLSRLPMRTKK
ncbi:hypothetical protein KAX02_02010 [candidate division WOR-3 bacterium]|nr:hypothetical protein [candidate division WOR-3 bacterium]